VPRRERVIPGQELDGAPGRAVAVAVGAVRVESQPIPFTTLVTVNEASNLTVALVPSALVMCAS
jgi:hypothetical protein